MVRTWHVTRTSRLRGGSTANFLEDLSSENAIKFAGPLAQRRVRSRVTLADLYNPYRANRHGHQIYHSIMACFKCGRAMTHPSCSCSCVRVGSSNKHTSIPPFTAEIHV